MQELIYAGIGARKTPAVVLQTMTFAAKDLSDLGWKLRSGNADGADKAFQAGANTKEVHLPWAGFNNPVERANFFVPEFTDEIQIIARRHHPGWSFLSDPVKRLMCRNVTIILGANLDSPARMVICWTKDGRAVGGTGMAIRVARRQNIPVFNIALPNDITQLQEFVRDIT